MTCGRIQTFLSLPVKLQTIDAKGSKRLVFCLRCPWQIRLVHKHSHRDYRHRVMLVVVQPFS